MDGTTAGEDGKHVQDATTQLAGAAGAAAGGAAEAKPLDAPAAAGEEQVDDAQVERFYALLASIRAMRGAYTPAGGDDSGGARRKRLRSAESPWKPAFRLEDFDDGGATSAASRCANRKEGSQPDAEVRKGARRFDGDSKSI